MKPPSLLVPVILLGILLPAGCRGTREGETRPDIFLITVDTLRADHLGCYGYPRDTSPGIDRFAREALLFERCLSHATETRTSFGSILSGFLPHETQVAIEGTPLLPEIDTLPEVLERLGYKTVAVVGNYLLKKEGGWDQGFSVYDDALNEHEAVRRVPERTAEPTTDRAIELLERFRDERLFMWVHYQDPHGPYTPPERFATLFEESGKQGRLLERNASLSGLGGIPDYQVLGETLDYAHYVSRYDGEIGYLDGQLQRLLLALERHSFYDDALILFTADHGEDMGEHGYFFSHGENVYHSSTHVPLIVRHGSALAGRRSDFVQHIDILPTIRNMLGLEPDPRLRGRDLREPQAEKEIVAEVRSPLAVDGFKVSIVMDGLKLICAPLFQRYELYDLHSDPREEVDLIRDVKLHDRAEDLIVRLDRILKEDRLKLQPSVPPKELTEEEREKLRSLGYAR